MFTFKVIPRESDIPGRPATTDVVRNDGKVVRSGLWPDYAEEDVKLFTRRCAEGWSAERYHKERGAKFEAMAKAAA